MKHNSITLLIVCIFFSGIFQSKGQTGEYNFEFLTREDGLSSNHIRCIFQDSFGFMWFGTDKGLNRYDGVNFVTYQNDPEDSLTVSNNHIMAIVEEPGTANLWIATLGGLNYFNREKNEFTRFLSDSLKNSVSHNYIYDIAYTDSTLWIGTVEYLDSYKKGHFESYKLPPAKNNSLEFNNNIVSSIEVDEGFLWVGTKEALCVFDLEKKTLSTKNFHEDLKYVVGLDKYNNGKIWFSTQYNGPFILEEGSEKARKVNDIFNFSDFINSRGIIEDDGDKVLIVNRNNGLNVLNLSDSTIFLMVNDPYNQQSISGEALVCGYRSRDGIIWFGTYNSGINIYDSRRKNFGHYKFNYKADGLINDNMRAVFQDSDDNIWIGTKENGSLSKFNKEEGSFTHYLPNENDPNALHGDFIFSIDEYDKDNLLIGTLYNGINVFNKKTGVTRHIKHDPLNPDGIGSNSIYAFNRRSATEIIVCSTEGIEIWDTKNNSFKRLDLFRNSRCIFVENENRIWIGNLHEGIFVFDSELKLVDTYRHIPGDTTSIGSDRISSIKRGPDNKIWICTGGGGLNYYVPESNSFRRLKEKDGLANNHVCEILFHDEEEYWLSTANGLSVYYPKTKTFRNYDKSDGLQSNEFSDYVALKLSSGELLFGGLNGFNLFDPEEIKENSLIPDIVFTDFHIHNNSAKIGAEHPLKKSIEFTDKIVLTHKDYIFSIGFAALNYMLPEKNQYQYKLEGFDSEWLTVKNEPFVTYTNLPPGDYIFKVMACNNDGFWNRQGARLAISVLPPWWETFGFRISVVFALFFLFFFVLYLRFRRYRKRKTEMQELINKRTEELKEAQAQLVHSEKMASLGVLTAGVAHEINNPLNFIQSGIYSLENVLKPGLDYKENEGVIKMVLDSMQTGVERAAKIVKSLNTFSRKDTEEKVTCDLQAIMDNCLTILNHELKECCVVQKEYHSEPLLIVGNQENLHQVFLNIIKNSLQSSQKEGIIKITTSKLKEKKLLQILISDNGEGISKENLEKIYDPFFTTKEAGEGVGLGLSIVFKIISDHNGTIEYDSILNKGTTVKILFPDQS